VQVKQECCHPDGRRKPCFVLGARGSGWKSCRHGPWHIACCPQLSKQGMLLLKRARVPAAVLHASVALTAPDPVEPSVLCDIAITGSRISLVRRSGEAAHGDGVRIVDLEGCLVLPGLVDAHVHLDKTHTWDRAPNRSGTFMDALETLGRDKDNWTRADILRRAGFALHCAWEHGTRVIRTHVDTWLPWGEVNHAAMQELREAWRGRIALQTVPLTAVANYQGSQGDAIADLSLKYGACALGGWSPMSADLPSQFDRMIAIARDRGVGLDLHVDESGDPRQEVLRTLAEAVLRNGFQNPVVCGHCCSLAVQEPPPALDHRPRQGGGNPRDLAAALQPLPPGPARDGFPKDAPLEGDHPHPRPARRGGARGLRQRQRPRRVLRLRRLRRLRGPDPEPASGAPGLAARRVGPRGHEDRGRHRGPPRSRQDRRGGPRPARRLPREGPSANS
jgi:hypothetical protein